MRFILGALAVLGVTSMNVRLEEHQVQYSDIEFWQISCRVLHYNVCGINTKECCKGLCDKGFMREDCLPGAVISP